MAGASVTMPPAVVRRQEVTECRKQVVVAAGTGLEDGDAGGRMGHEHMEQAIAAGSGESFAVSGQVQHGLTVAGSIRPRFGIHGPDRAIGE